jgi:hypothetical protein
MVFHAVFQLTSLPLSFFVHISPVDESIRYPEQLRLWREVLLCRRLSTDDHGEGSSKATSSAMYSAFIATSLRPNAPPSLRNPFWLCGRQYASFGSWDSLGRRGVELRLRGMHKQQKREDARMQAAKGHNDQALRKKDAASIPSTLFCSIEMSGLCPRTAIAQASKSNFLLSGPIASLISAHKSPFPFSGSMHRTVTGKRNSMAPEKTRSTQGTREGLGVYGSISNERS